MSTLTGLVAADAVDLALLDGAQQLGLQAGVHLADFVQQQGAAVGFLELADAAGDGAGEGALLVAEQLALEQVLGDGGAVDADEGPVGARTWVDVAGHDFLTDAAFAGDQDRGFGTGDLVGQRITACIDGSRRPSSGGCRRRRRPGPRRSARRPAAAG
jgi:hypothetical protein